MTAAAGARTGLEFTGAAMELATADGPAATLDGLTVRLTATGIAVEGPGDATERSVPWPEVEEGRCGELGFLPTGEPAVALSVKIAGRYVRWLVPSDQLPPDRAMAVDALLAGRTAMNATATNALATNADAGDATSAAAANGSAAKAAVSNGSPGVPPYWAPEPLPGAARGLGTDGVGRPASTDGSGAAAHPGAEAEAEGTPLLPLVTPVFGPVPGVPVSGPLPSVDAGVPGPMPSDPVGGPSTGPGPSARTRTADPWRRPSLRTLLAALWTLLALLVVLAVLLLVAGLRQSGTTSAPSHGAPASQRLLAVEVNLAKGDFPSGWTVDTSATAPLTGFLGAGVDAGGGLAAAPAAAPAQRGQAARVARRFSQCLGVPASKDRVFTTAGTRPVARGSSAAYEGPASGPPLEAGSVTAVYRSSAAVSAAMGEVLRPRFPTCFGQAVTSQVQEASTAATTAATYGSPSIHPLTLPAGARVRAAGVDLDFPVSVDGAATGVQLGFVFIGGGRVASTLVTFGTSTGFPATLTARLTQAVERHIVALGKATGVGRRG